MLTKKPDKYYSYLHDAHKRIQFELEAESIRSRANITAIYDINAYGKILSESGTPHTPFRYASYYYDTDTELYYLQNCYYAADKARFMTEDPYWNVSNMLYGKFTSAVERRVYYPAVVQSGNRYAYGINNPVCNTDRTGLAVHVGEFSVTLGIGVFGGLKFAVVWDDSGNWGIQPAFSIGGGVGASIGADYYEFTHLENISDLNNGASLSTGGGVGAFGLSQEIGGGDVALGGGLSGAIPGILPTEMELGYYSVYNFSRVFVIIEEEKK